MRYGIDVEFINVETAWCRSCCHTCREGADEDEGVHDGCFFIDDTSDMCKLES